MIYESIILRLLAFTFVAGADRLHAEESLEEIEARYTADFRNFEAETHNELARLASDKSLSGEEKMLRVAAWFATQSQDIAAINAMADTLDKLNPLPNQSSANRTADPSPEGTAAAEIHRLNARLAKGEITAEELDRLRTPHLVQLSAPKDQAKPAPKALLPPLFDGNINARSNELEISAALRAQYCYLATLPEQEAARIRADAESPISRLLLILNERKQLRELNGTSNLPNNSQKETNP